MAKAVEVLQKEIGYSNVEALGETLQNIVNDNTAQQVEGLPSNEVAEELNKAYKQLDLTSYSSEEIRRMIQFTFLKAAKEDGLQMNHQMTPDAIGLLVAYMIEERRTVADCGLCCRKWELAQHDSIILTICW